MYQPSPDHPICQWATSILMVKTIQFRVIQIRYPVGSYGRSRNLRPRTQSPPCTGTITINQPHRETQGGCLFLRCAYIHKTRPCLSVLLLSSRLALQGYIAQCVHVHRNRWSKLFLLPTMLGFLVYIQNLSLTNPDKSIRLPFNKRHNSKAFRYKWSCWNRVALMQQAHIRLNMCTNRMFSSCRSLNPQRV